MKRVNHIVVATAFTLDTLCVYQWVSKFCLYKKSVNMFKLKYINDVIDMFIYLVDWCFKFFLDYFHANTWYFIPLLLFSLFIGSTLPDSDGEYGLIYKLFKVKIEHRTWTHTIWVVIALFMMSLAVKELIWITIYYLLHLIVDSFSTCGVCFTYPLSSYRYYGNRGAKIKYGHNGIYKVGSDFEYLIAYFLLFSSFYFVKVVFF